ncbi:MAG: alpha-hydroxy-acid oxidizing protein [Rhodospirillales bacterium]|nr:alpha-hydroxy-acid oxidizing protein [Rhodospirillales bacterium]
MSNKYLTIDDLRNKAAKRIPKLAFDYLDGGAGTEANITRNRRGFDNITLYPEYLRDVTDRSQKATVFGKEYDAPIGVSPVGLANLIWPKVDSYLANMAKKRNIPYLLSAVGTTSIETIANIAEDNAWFQLYVPDQDNICFDLIRRAKESGIKVLVLTVDIPEPSKRLRDIRNNFTLPFKMTPKVIMDIALKPNWAISTLLNGTPRFENLVPYMNDAKDGTSLSVAQALQVSARLGEDFINRIRDAWEGHLVIKGILTKKSAEASVRIGADGIIVSNHGGRQLDSGPSSIEVLPDIFKTVGSKLTVMLDSGIRSGPDIVKAFASGAAITFSGRSFVFGVGALGEKGGNHVLDIMVKEVDQTLAQIGCDNILKLDESYINSS